MHMQFRENSLDAIERAQVMRYAINGLMATAIHFAILSFNLQVLGLPSAGVANFIAAIFGITASFLGSRYFVFQEHTEPLLKQAAKFGALYATIAVLHGVVLFGWSDIFAFDYRLGFLLATLLQVTLSYFGNKKLVFNK